MAPPSQEVVDSDLYAEVQVMVELGDAPAGVALAAAVEEARQEAAALEINGNRPPAVNASNEREPITISAAASMRIESIVQTLDNVQRSLLPTLTGPDIGGQVIYRAQRAYNGIAMVVHPDKIADIAALPGVKAVHPLIPKTVDAFQDIDFLGARGPGGPWNKIHPNGGGVHGEGMKIVVIDTGLDYVHTNFDGPGTAEAYAAVGDGTSPTNPYYPSLKVPNGYDFSGNTYNASGTGAALIPQPDPNPFDTSNGHGTGCASLAAGFGVNAGGTRYVGNYDDNTPIAAMRIAPGFAPEAKIYPVRIIGAGSTNLIVPAVEWSMNPANFGGTLPDVITMSIGGAEGRPNDPDAVAFTNAANAGIVCTLSAGNNGNTYYIHGGPSVANNVLSVAASFNDQAGYIYDAQVTGNQPASLAGRTAFAIHTTGSSKGTVTGDVVQLKPNDSPAGNTPVSNAAEISGKICLVDRVPGQGANAVQRAKTAGAIGVIFIANQEQAGGDPFLLATTPTTAPTIPEVMIGTQDGNNLKAAAQFDANGVSTTTPRANVTISNASGSVSRAGIQADQMTSYSSRGPRHVDSFLKPDITAPAEVVGVASTKTGSGLRLFNGTSSAAPHIGGAMVLLRQLHPTWTAEELRALAMNASIHDLFSGPITNRIAQEGVSRVGAGRINLQTAAASDVVIYNKTNPGLVSLSFGVVDCVTDGIAEGTKVTKEVTVKNKGASPVTYNLSYQDVTPASDAGFQTNHPLTFTVPANSSINIPITFAATGHLLKHSRDPSVPASQNVTASAQLPRQWLTEKAGYAIFTPTSGGGQPTLRLPLHAVPRAVGTMHAVQSNPSVNADAGQFNVRLAGNPVNTGPNVSSTAAQPGQDVVGLVKPFDLQYRNDSANPTSPNQLKFVGVTSDYAAKNAAGQKVNTVLAFVTETFADQATPRFAGGFRRIFIDGDLKVDDVGGPDDFALWSSHRAATASTPTNVYQTVLAGDPNYGPNPNLGSGFFTGYYTNGFPSNFRDTNTFNNSVQIYHVNASALGYNGGPTRFRYRVESFDNLGNLVDSTPYLFYDVANPGYDGSNGNIEPFYYQDLPGATATVGNSSTTSNGIPVNYSGANMRNFSTSTIGLLLVHMHNAPGQRSDVVAIAPPTIQDFQPKSGPVGTLVAITGSNFSTAVEVFFNGTKATDVAVFSSNGLQARVPPGATTGPITVRNAGGSDDSSDLDDPSTPATDEGVFTVTP